MFNISLSTDEKTARTCLVCAKQRAENLSILGAKSVLELCVGPSLKTLEKVYGEHKITVAGNDIDERWQRYYPVGKWLIGDATKLKNISMFDAVVVAPPLSKNCSGKREDSLSIEEVNPSFTNFLHLTNKTIVFVLPGRTLSVKNDLSQLHRLLSIIRKEMPHRQNIDIVPLKNKVNKYIDLYIY